ncbi:putative cobalt transporter subunit family protein [Pseudomonas paraeruginosa]|nr:putative cobalt transporter subunit family protein [Pseudomonas paraeruginosa]
MIKRIAQTAGFAGLLAALLLSLLQILWVTPLILEAETYENSEPVAAQPHEHAPGVAAHVHDEEAWEPENGWQRTLSTTGGNLVVAVGFALMLAGLFTLRAPGRTWQGLLWAWPATRCSALRRRWACRRSCREPPRPTWCNASTGGSPPQPPPRWAWPCWRSAATGR